MNNPIIQRELVGILRSGRMRVVAVLLVVALAALVLLRWPSDAKVGLDGQEPLQVLRVFAYGLLAGLILLAPVFPATGIVRERIGGTLALLLNSDLGPFSIVWGKLIGSVGYVLLLLVLSIPASAACFTMGGIDLFGQLGMLYLVLFVLAIHYATLALLVSSFAATTDGALRLTYALILTFALVTLGPARFFGTSADAASITATANELHPVVGPILGQLFGTVAGLLESVGLSLGGLFELLRSASPLSAITAVLGDDVAIRGGVVAGGGTATRFVVFALLASVVCFLWTVRRVSRRPLDRARDGGVVTDDRSTTAKAYRRLMYLWFFDPKRRSGLTGPLSNPVMVKEQRCRRFGRGNWMMRLIMVCLIVSLGLMLIAALSSQGAMAGGSTSAVNTLGGVIVLLQVALIVLLTPSLGGGLIAAEIESRGWQLLQMTPLSAITIVTGKLMSVMVTLFLLLLATLPGYVVLVYIQPTMLDTVVNVLITLLLTAAVALLVTAAVSSLSNKTATATAVSYGLLMTLIAGTLLLWLGRGAPFSHGLVERALSVNPLAAALSLIEAPGFAHYELVPTNWWVCGVLSVASLLVLLVRVWMLSRPR